MGVPIVQAEPVAETPNAAPAEESSVAAAPKTDYDVTIATPMGKMDGKVVLNINGTSLSGKITFMGKENEFTGGTIDENGNVSFKGDLKTPIGKMPYTITGSVAGNVVKAVAKTRMGDLAIESK